jgi:hypothetical protein
VKATTVAKLILITALSGQGAGGQNSPPALPESGGAPAVRVRVSLREKVPLRLVKFVYAGGEGELGLEGELELTITNEGTIPVTVRDLDVHGLLFEDERTAARSLLIHPCDCAVLLEDTPLSRSQVKRQTAVIAPGESRSSTLEGFGCAGGMWVPPPPGTYLLTCRVLVMPQTTPPPVSQGSPHPLSTAIRECRRMLLSEEFWRGAAASPPLRITLRPPERKRVTG